MPVISNVERHSRNTEPCEVQLSHRLLGKFFSPGRVRIPWCIRSPPHKFSLYSHAVFKLGALGQLPQPPFLRASLQGFSQVQARARSMHRCYPVSGLAAVGARHVLRRAKSESPCTRTAAKVARLAAPCFIDRIQTVPPNPSIERTCPGKPGHASHLHVRPRVKVSVFGLQSLRSASKEIRQPSAASFHSVRQIHGALTSQALGNAGAHSWLRFASFESGRGFFPSFGL